MDAHGNKFPLWTEALIHSRRTIRPRHLGGPEPSEQQKSTVLRAASAAPDHGRTTPWRLIEVPLDARERLGFAFEQALLQRDGQATDSECARAREKAGRAPWLLLLVVRLPSEQSKVPLNERLISAGAAIQNMLLTCAALDLASAVTSGQSINSAPVREFFELGADEEAVCFVNVGQLIGQYAPKKTDRPQVSAYFSVLKLS